MSCPFLTYTKITLIHDKDGDCAFEVDYADSVTAVECMKGSCDLWDKTKNQCGFVTAREEETASRKILQHIHEVHYHRFSPDMGKAGILAQEWLCSEDLDKNGMIYGEDFHFPEGDCPPVLANIPKEGAAMSMASYLAGFSSTVDVAELEITVTATVG